MASGASRIFIIGGTGFVGGSILAAICELLPEAQIIGLVRKEWQAEKLRAAYSNFTALMGDTASLELLTETATTVDFVVYAAGDNVPAVSALIDGLAAQGSAVTTNFQPCLISITGPRSLLDQSQPATGKIDPTAPIWSDVEDVQKILCLPADRAHAGADQEIVSYSRSKRIGTMLVSPGQLWGRGQGICKQEASSAMYYSVVEQRGHAFVIGDGSVEWSWCSNRDLGRAVAYLVSLALFSQDNSPRLTVNEQGYYFVQTGDLSMRQRAEAVSRRLNLGDVHVISAAEASDIHPFGPMMWGRGARFRADRLKSLGWRPHDHDWVGLMEEYGGRRA